MRSTEHVHRSLARSPSRSLAQAQSIAGFKLREGMPIACKRGRCAVAPACTQFAGPPHQRGHSPYPRLPGHPSASPSTGGGTSPWASREQVVFPESQPTTRWTFTQGMDITMVIDRRQNDEHVPRVPPEASSGCRSSELIYPGAENVATKAQVNKSLRTPKKFPSDASSPTC